MREVAPQADPATRTFEVKVGIDNPPPAMRLGATVIGEIVLESEPAIAIPATALMQAREKPAVWVVDPAENDRRARGRSSSRATSPIPRSSATA